MDAAGWRSRFVRALGMENGPLIKDRPVILERLSGYYNAWYDVSPGDQGSGLPLEALYQYRSRAEKYVLSKKAKLWAAETNDYLYLFTMPNLNKQLAEECVSFAVGDALPRVKPHSEHMYSFISAIFVADRIGDGACAFIRRCAFNKGYKLGLHGSSPLKTAAFDAGEGKIVTNCMGRDLRRQIGNICKERKK